MAIVLQFAGHLADWLQRKRIMNTTNVRKLLNCSAFLAQVFSLQFVQNIYLFHEIFIKYFLQTVFMIAACFAPDSTTCIVFLVIAVGLGGFAWSGFR